MNDTLSEEEMRQALFGNAVLPARDQGAPQLPRVSKRLSARLRVTLHVTKVFEGPEEVFVYDANTLSTLIAEAEAKRKKFRYFDLVSIKPVLV